jgi:rfaE bifunctional protein kinase chain/domain
MMNKKTTNAFQFSNCKILVIGDVMLDKYIHGKATRISPEAPVPIVKTERKTTNLGGAGNVASNISALGAKVTLTGLVGKDEYAEQVRILAEKNEIDGILLEVNFPTITKTRIIASQQQIVRIDEEEFQQLSKKEIQTLIDINQGLIPFHDIVIISDYGKGLIGTKFIQEILLYCKRKKIPVLVDPKSNEWSKYEGCFLITPNVKELGEVVGKQLINEDKEIEKAGAMILKKFNFENILVTRSEKGMTLINRKEIKHFNSVAKEVFDVSGAGDTVIGVLGTALANHWDIKKAIELANIAGGIIVSKSGTATIEKVELEKSWK